MKYFKKLVGKRVYLSPMNVEDAETYVKWLNDFNVTDGVRNSSRVISLEGEREWIGRNSSQYQFAIVLLENDKLIGNCGFHGIDHLRQCAEVGLFIGDEENRNKGYGEEVLNLLIDYGFDYLNLNNIMLRVFAFNERAISCYKKVGFKEIGRRRQAYYLKGKFHDEVFMDILREERYAMRENREELRAIMAKFAESGWDLIAAPAKAWLEGKGDKNALISAIEQADRECGSCGCEFDALYKRALALKELL